MKSQRDAFFDTLYDIKDDRIVVLAADCGCLALNQWKGTKRFINVGIAEQNMISIARGLALSGMRPYCYGIIPFVTMRCLDQTRIACMMNLPITIVGIGAGFSYSDSGATHHAIEDIGIMRMLPKMKIASPSNAADASGLARVYDSPTYIRLDRGNDALYTPHIILRGIGETTYFPLWLKPFKFPEYLDFNTVTEIEVEEEHLNGGLGSIVADYLAEHNLCIPLVRKHIKEGYYYHYGREELRKNAFRMES